jgi:hypothetical protein
MSAPSRVGSGRIVQYSTPRKSLILGGPSPSMVHAHVRDEAVRLTYAASHAHMSRSSSLGLVTPTNHSNVASVMSRTGSGSIRFAMPPTVSLNRSH